MDRLTLIQREMVMAHKRGAWDTVRWLAEKSMKLRSETK